jgi:hypothetical protein
MDDNRLTQEISGEKLSKTLIAYIDAKGGRYLNDETGTLHVILGGKRIALDGNRENDALAKLMLDACMVSTLFGGAQVALQRLRVHAREYASRFRFRRFSAMSGDGTGIYIPIAGGELLLVKADGIREVPNGENADHFWLEHPNTAPLHYSENSAWHALQHFERLVVSTQACIDPAMRWFVAVNMALFVFVRDSCPARFLMELIGPSQPGKTTGAERATRLLGLGQVKGDFSVATLGNVGDIGLLALDNKEQANYSQPLIDYLLFLSTGGDRGRSYSDGRVRVIDTGRPVGVITTIEGVVKSELQNRCVEVQYGSTEAIRLQRGPIEREIESWRHHIVSGFVLVLMRYLQIRDECRRSPNPLPNFEEHFTAVCDLLRAYEDVAGKPEGWSEAIIAKWDKTIRAVEKDDDDLEHPISRVLRESRSDFDKVQSFKHLGKQGTLYITQADTLRTLLQKLNIRDLQIPKANGLSRRLNNARFRGFTYLPTGNLGSSDLRRKGHMKPIGFFVPDP